MTQKIEDDMDTTSTCHIGWHRHYLRMPRLHITLKVLIVVVCYWWLVLPHFGYFMGNCIPFFCLQIFRNRSELSPIWGQDTLRASTEEHLSDRVRIEPTIHSPGPTISPCFLCYRDTSPSATMETFNITPENRTRAKVDN